MNLFYLAALVTAALALTIALWPLLRQGYSKLSVVVGIAAVAGGFGVYQLASNYDPALPTQLPVAEDAANAASALKSLEARLREQPDDREGWALLARTYMSIDQIDKAIVSFRRAYELSSDSDPVIMLDYAEALAAKDPDNLTREAGELIESALKIAPDNLRALWYGGSVAAARGNRPLAATRFEKMLRPDTPDNVRSVLVANIQALRGEAPTNAPATNAEAGMTLSVQVGLSPELAAGIPSTAVFYLIATTSAGGPPLAVVKLPVAAIPGEIEIGDADAMMAGRTISTQSEIKLTARISMAGQPIAKSGDLFAERQVSLPNTEELALTISQVVP